MAFISRLFPKKDKTSKESRDVKSNLVTKQKGEKTVASLNDKKEQIIPSPECQRLKQLNNKMNALLTAKKYVAKSEYLTSLLEYQNVIDYFQILKSSETLGTFCAKNHISADRVLQILDCYAHFEDRLETANEKFISEKLVNDKEYLDNILKEVDPMISLDEDQRRVVLTDEDYMLVVAGAGAGKTTTVAAKVKYLVEKQNINPRDILVISFTNKAVGELRDRINKQLQIDCPIATFHSTGNAILHIHNPEQVNIADGSKLYYLLLDYFRESILRKESLVKNLILFFATYFDAPYEGDDLNEFFNKIAKSNFSTMRSDLEDFKREVIDSRSKKKVTIQNEILRSNQEVQIANFLYLNSIDYDYEPVYPYRMPYSRKPYTPDFIIRQGEQRAYIEHFGISEDGKNNLYSEVELARYKKRINDKVVLHKDHGTKLIYTFSSYKDGRTLTEHLQEALQKAGFELKERPYQEVMEKIVSTEESRYIRGLIGLISRFINIFKTNGYTVEEFRKMYNSTNNVRSRLFLTICEDCFLEYERYLRKNNMVDFQDMINQSARVIKDVKEMGQKLHFKYIIVDEYQDISRQRFDLTTAISEVCDGKIIAVGDDWQSIYAFSGSDLSLFTDFVGKMGYGKLLKIVRTYRNAQEVIDIAGNFIQKNPTQIGKSLISPKRIEDPVIIYTYDGKLKKTEDNRTTGANYAAAFAIETALSQIIEYNRQAGKKEGEDGSILLLGRYGFDGDHLEKTGLFEYVRWGNKIKSVKYPKLDISFMTVHKSKGLGYDNVIIINCKNETFGFPSKIEDDPILSLVIKEDRSIDYAEERRLFYVAMTRTKNRVFMIAPEQNPSEFLLELKKEYKNIILQGEWNEEVVKRYTTHKKCPICGYPMQYKYKNAYGLRLYICTNEPEICDFMTNNAKAGKLSIMKCNQCNDGYLIVKPSYIDNSYFLGCTNYKHNKKGCNNTLDDEEYFLQMGMLEEQSEAKKMKAEYRVKSDTNPIQSNKNSSFKTANIEEAKKQNIQELEQVVPVSIIEPTNVITEEESPFSQKEIIELLEKEPNQYNYEKIVSVTLECLKEISEMRFYGISVLRDTLQGQKTQTIQDAGFDSISEFGSLSFMKTAQISAVIQWLIDNHFMIQTKGKFSKLHVTYEGNHLEESLTPLKLKHLAKYVSSPDRQSFPEKVDSDIK